MADVLTCGSVRNLSVLGCRPCVSAPVSSHDTQFGVCVWGLNDIFIPFLMSRRDGSRVGLLSMTVVRSSAPGRFVGVVVGCGVVVVLLPSDIHSVPRATTAIVMSRAGEMGLFLRCFGVMGGVC